MTKLSLALICPIVALLIVLTVMSNRKPQSVPAGPGATPEQVDNAVRQFVGTPNVSDNANQVFSRPSKTTNAPLAVTRPAWVEEQLAAAGKTNVPK